MFYGSPVIGFPEEITRRGEAHVFACEDVGHMGGERVSDYNDDQEEQGSHRSRSGGSQDPVDGEGIGIGRAGHGAEGAPRAGRDDAREDAAGSHDDAAHAPGRSRPMLQLRGLCLMTPDGVVQGDVFLPPEIAAMIPPDVLARYTAPPD